MLTDLSKASDCLPHTFYFYLFIYFFHRFKSTGLTLNHENWCRTIFQIGSNGLKLDMNTAHGRKLYVVFSKDSVIGLIFSTFASVISSLL